MLRGKEFWIGSREEHKNRHRVHSANDQKLEREAITLQEVKKLVDKSKEVIEKAENLRR